MSSYTENTNNISREGVQTVPFESAQEAWFWLVAAQSAHQDGANLTRGASLFPRPCEPIDVLKVVDRLYRNRRITRDHISVLRHYGLRYLPPEPRRVKEVRASVIWDEAMERIEAVLISKGIVRTDIMSPRKDWQKDALVMNGKV